MEINIKREFVKKYTIAGSLYIEGVLRAHTLEQADDELPAGRYIVLLVQCKASGEPMPLVLTPVQAQDFRKGIKPMPYRKYVIYAGGQEARIPYCAKCSHIRDMYANKRLKNWCPMLRPANGVIGCYDGRICVGARRGPCAIIHAQHVWNAVCEYMKDAQVRGEDIVLTIENPERSL